MNRNTRRAQILFDFESLVDIKIGLIYYMQEMFKHSKTDPNTLSKINIEKLYDGLEREEQCYTEHMYFGDPFKAVLCGEALEHVDELYKQFLTEYYEGIMNRAPITLMVRLIRNYQISGNNIGSIKPYIFCTSDLQEAFCNKYIKGVPIVKGKDRSDVSLSDYSSLVIPYLTMIPEYDLDIQMTNIYCLNFRENFEPDDDKVPLVRYSMPFSDTNQIRFYSPFENVPEPKG